MEFRKKPVLVDAVQYTPGLEDGYACYVIGGGRFVGYHDKGRRYRQLFAKFPRLKRSKDSTKSARATGLLPGFWASDIRVSRRYLRRHTNPPTGLHTKMKRTG